MAHNLDRQTVASVHRIVALTGIGTVHIQPLQARILGVGRHGRQRGNPILHTGGRDHSGHYQPERIHDKIALAPFDLLPASKPASTPRGAWRVDCASNIAIVGNRQRHPLLPLGAGAVSNHTQVWQIAQYRLSSRYGFPMRP
jgi:hypothetical protein